jgi:SAM-dependent methyltransferase
MTTTSSTDDTTGDTAEPEIDPGRLDEFVGRLAGDVGAAMHASTVVLGDKLGLYQALAAAGPCDPAGLAGHTGCDPRLVEEWLRAQFVSGYCHHDGAAGTFWLDPEQAAVLASPDHPAFMVGAMTVALSTAKDEDRVREAFRSGAGLGWHEHHADLFTGVERLFKPGYLANLVSAWIPALSGGVEDRLRAGARVADLGCGHGASTILLAEAYPASEIVGYDYHRASVEVARARADEAGLGDRVRFAVATAQDFPGDGYDLVCVFDALHDMGDPLGAAAHIRSALAPDGTFLLVEPMAGDTLADNANVVGRIFYSASTFICTPSAQSQEGAYALGAQVPDGTWAEVMTRAGFGSFERATETPFNRVFQARP